eukprot:TRINITY_DN4088_c0_g1_i1.p2 TRINITY_DN4088_c0_g1~~TRINITY_DN4088_c0_g1_i1.p2  ORF type:complete len:223 (-),score=37.89 TRINITY_DN4088_c0_g1_i1:1336-2004(-)
MSSLSFVVLLSLFCSIILCSSSSPLPLSSSSIIRNDDPFSTAESLSAPGGGGVYHLIIYVNETSTIVTDDIFMPYLVCRPQPDGTFGYFTCNSTTIIIPHGCKDDRCNNCTAYDTLPVGRDGNQERKCEADVPLVDPSYYVDVTYVDREACTGPIMQVDISTKECFKVDDHIYSHSYCDHTGTPTLATCYDASCTSNCTVVSLPKCQLLCPGAVSTQCGYKP